MAFVWILMRLAIPIALLVAACGHSQAARPAPPAPPVPPLITTSKPLTPQRTIEKTPTGPGEGATVAPEDVLSRIQRTYMSGLKRCHRRLLMREPRAGGKVTLHFTVEPGGKVSRAAVAGFDAGVDACIENRLARWTFRAPRNAAGAAQRATYEITLALQPD